MTGEFLPAGFNSKTQLRTERAAPEAADGIPIKSTSYAETSMRKTQRNEQGRCRQPRRKRRQPVPQITRNISNNLSSETKAWMDNVIIPLLLQRIHNELAVKKAA